MRSCLNLVNDFDCEFLLICCQTAAVFLSRFFCLFAQLKNCCSVVHTSPPSSSPLSAQSDSYHFLNHFQISSPLLPIICDSFSPFLKVFYKNFSISVFCLFPLFCCCSIDTLTLTSCQTVPLLLPSICISISFSCTASTQQRCL